MRFITWNKTWNLNCGGIQQNLAIETLVPLYTLIHFSALYPTGMITLPFNMVSNTTVECTPDKNSGTGNATGDEGGGGGGSSYSEQKMVRSDLEEQKSGKEVS